MKKKIILFIFIVVFIYAAGGLAYYYTNKKPAVINISSLDTIKGYNYTLKSNDTLIYTNEFKTLKSNLESDSIDYEEYAKSIAKLFIIDLYTLNNKINKYDVGGTLYIHPDYINNYKLNVQDTLYKYIEDNSNKLRNQELPEVSSTEIINTEEIKFNIGDNEYDGYKINIKWDYVKDLGYDTEGEVLVIKDNNNCYVVEKN